MSDQTSIKTQSDMTASSQKCHPEESRQRRDDEGSRVRELLARSFFYQLFSELLRHPSAGRDRIFVEESKGACQEAVQFIDGERRGQVGKLLNELFDKIKQTSDADWATAYESCLGHTAHSRVPAYELEYGEEHSHRQPQELADITAFYQAFGFQVSKKAHERPDHVTVECELMHALLYKEAYALNQGEEEHATICREGSKQFLSEHLAKWFPAFTFRLSKFHQDGLMKLIADAAFYFILAECEAQGISLGAKDLSVRAIQEKEETDCVSCQFGPGMNKAAKDM